MSARQGIVQAAAHAFAARGYHAVSMRDLARSTGRSPATFYSHFRSKEELLFSMQRDAFDTLIERAQAAVAQLADPEARLRAFLENHVAYFAENPDLMRVLIHEAAALPHRSREIIRRRKERYFEIGRALVVPLVPKRTPPRELERVTYCAFGMLNWTYSWYQPELHGSASELAGTIFRILTTGLRRSAP
jgi:AcrR family transcriptional regulator